MAKNLWGGHAEDAVAVECTYDGGFIVAASTTSNDGDVSGNHGGEDCWVFKLDSSGTIIWQKCYGGSGYDNACAIIKTADNGFVVLGTAGSSDGNIQGYHGGGDYWLIKIDSIGNLKWSKCYGGNDSEEAAGISATSDKGFLLSGYSISTNGNVTGINGSSFDFWVVKTDSVGQLLWQKSFGGSSTENKCYIKETTDGGYIIAGNTESNNGDISGNHAIPLYDVWVAKLDAGRNISWQNCYGGTNDDVCEDMQITPDGGMILIGNTESTDGDITGNHGGEDYWVLKFDHVTGIKQYAYPGVHIWPNPCNNILKIDAEKPFVNLTIYNVLGKEILVAKDTEIDMSNIPDGVYFIHVKTNADAITQKIIVRH